MLDLELDWNDAQQLRETVVTFLRRGRLFGVLGKALRGYPDNEESVEAAQECVRSTELYAELLEKVLARIEELEAAEPAPVT